MHKLVMILLLQGLLFITYSPSFAMAENDEDLKGEITVTGAREEQKKADTPATVDMVDKEQIRNIKPSHPSEIVNRVPGVLVSVTGGEGHTTSIRQPLTTAAVYLYLEDGIPIRSTGFFNHNALYEVNIPMADGLEVTKGPGTSLYGSDSIGGIINSLTKPAPQQTEAEANLEAGSFGWTRTLVGGGTSWGNHGVRADLNVTHTDGWRDSTDYDRQSTTFRYDGFVGDSLAIKSVIAYSKIDQQTAGSSRLSEEDYLNNPEFNYTPISWRKVEALRFSVSLDSETADSLFSLTPYARMNKLSYIANWSLSYDPSILESSNDSVGVIVKYRRKFAPMDTMLVIGADIDQSPGGQIEDKIKPSKEGNIYTGYTNVGAIYDYKVTFTGVSPYVHLETKPADKLLFSAGVRYDNLGYGYINNLDDVDTGSHRRPADTNVSYSHMSPKLGAVYQFSSSFNGFISYKNAFRVPSQSQLFRQGKTENSVGLKPVNVDSYETGIRWTSSRDTGLEISFYQMEKRDDIVSYTYPDKSSELNNAGKTMHKGVEVGAKTRLADWATFNMSASWAEHTYEDWKPKEDLDYSGNEMSSAPKLVASAWLTLTPDFLGGASLELEYVKLGEYWLDDENTEKYDGHDLFNLRVGYVVGAYKIYGRVMNITDERWATAASYSQRGGREFAPGSPLSFTGGFTYSF
ncbi:MAG: TonB-dependent receptor [Nitrospinota bacterium]|nr:TonB-dependent receptor [Nitrospinota bacterium]